MKKTLLLAAVFAASYGFSQENLLLNGTGDEYTSNTSDNADAWDMTPNPELVDNSGATITSPYQVLWNNTDLGTYLETTYNGGSGVDEQPGSTSDGNFVDGVKTRGLKLYGDGDPVVSESTRRIYQKVAVTAGSSYIFSLESRSEAENIPSEVFILNEEITTEDGLDADATSVDAYLEITNDFNSSKSSETEDNFTSNELSFTATGDFVVVYIRALLANTGDTEVFYDNLSLVEDPTASSDDVLASKFAVYPNPASDIVTISSDVELTSVALYNALGAKVYASSNTSSLSVAGLAKGVYFLKVDSADSSATKKLIVE